MAAEQLSRAGHFDEGIAVLKDVMAAVKLPYPRTPRVALGALAVQRAKLRLRGMKLASTNVELSAADRTRLDATWTASVSLGLTDTIRGAVYQTRNLLLALAANEPYRVARALAAEGMYRAVIGNEERVRAMELADLAAHLATEHDKPHALGLAETTRGFIEYFEGRFEAAAASFDRAESILRERCMGVAWELDNARFMGLWSRFFLGRIGELTTQTHEYRREAEALGDLYMATTLDCGPAQVVLLHQDRADDARQLADDSIARWSKRGRTIQHYYHLQWQAHVDLYADDPQAALRRLDEEWPKFARAFLMRVQVVRVMLTECRARAALACAQHEPDGVRFIERARADAKALLRERTRFTDAFATQISAAVAALSGDTAKAAEGLRTAIVAFEALKMPISAAVCRVRLGQLDESAEARTAERIGHAWLRQAGFVRPERWVAMLAPGFVTPEDRRR